MKIFRLGYVLVLFIVLSSLSYAATPAVRVVITEFVSQTVAYDQVYGPEESLIEAPGELGENRTGYSRTNISLSDISITGFINISNVEIVGGQTLSSINVTIIQTDNITRYQVLSSPSYVLINSSVSLTNPAGATNISLFIPELRAGDSIIMNFTVNSTNYAEPLNFTEEYSFWRVLTGHDVNVTLNVTHQFSKNVPLFDIEIYKIPQIYPSANGGDTFFTFHGLSGEDSGNADIVTDGLGRSVLNWNASGGIMVQGETRQIIFNSTAPVNISFNWSNTSNWASWMVMGNLSASFKLNGSITGLQLNNVTAISTAARLAVSKARLNESGYWNSSINITNDAPAPLDYEVESITLWATQYNQYSDPGNINTWINETQITATSYGSLANAYANATWFLKLNLSQGLSLDNYSLAFNYSLIPIVWATANFYILDDGYQMYKINQTSTRPDLPYLFIEEIYVLLGGYLVKVTKNLVPLNSPTNPNVYLVNVTLENIGTEVTPDLVTVFDLVPKDYYPLRYSTLTNPNARNMTENNEVLRITTQSGTWQRLYYAGADTFLLGYSDSGEIISGPYQGYWGYHLDFKSINATSNGDGIYTSLEPTKEVAFSYYIKGNQSLSRIENAYLVGVDPIRLEGANPSQSVASRLSIYSHAKEFIVVAITLLVSLVILFVSAMFGDSRKRYN